MTIFRNVVFLAAIAGLVAGLLLSAMQAFQTTPLIMQAEAFENVPAASAAPDNHATSGHATSDHASSEQAAADHAADGHTHDQTAWVPADGFERSFYTVVANVAVAIGFALLLVVASEFAGGLTGWRQGLVWGLAGFAVFSLAPGLGLPPELPGMPAADFSARQTWWIGTVAATAVGLALLVFGRSAVLAVIGVALIVAPHIIGAPHPASFETAVPVELHRSFVVAVTISTLVFWLALGAIAGALRPRFLETHAAHERLA